MIKCALIFMVMCATLVGCNSSAPLISESGSAETTQSTTVDTNIQSGDEVIVRDKEVLEDWSNWTDGSLSYAYGSTVNLLAKRGEGDELSQMFDGKTEAIDGELSIYVNYRLDLENYPYEGEADMIMLVAVNDVLCNFNLNGEKSDNGYLSTRRTINLEAAEYLTIDDCNLVAGENEVSVFLVAYFPQIGHISANCISRPFQSDTIKTQSQLFSLDVSEFSDASKVTVNDVEKQEISTLKKQFSEFVFDRISFDESKRCHTISKNSAIAWKLVNQADTQVSEQQKSICLVLQDGVLIPAWNGEKLLNMSLTDKDISVNLPISCDMNEGTYSHISFVSFDLCNDGLTTWSESLFYINKE